MWNMKGHNVEYERSDNNKLYGHVTVSGMLKGLK